MSAARPGGVGATRTCPHCRSTVLLSANVCPACRHHLRFNAANAAPEPVRTQALSVEGTVALPASAGPCEYCVVVSVSNARGESIARQVIGVGALQPGEPHTYRFSVELLAVRS